MAKIDVAPIKDVDGKDVNEGDKISHATIGPGRPMDVLKMDVPGTNFSLHAFDGQHAYYALDNTYRKA